MPNFIDNKPINETLKSKIARVRNEKAKYWFSHHARNWLSHREDCAQLITWGEPNLPDWAIRRLQAGEAIHRFRLSETADDILTNCLRYIRSLEYTIDEQDVEVTFIHEATRRLDELRNITPDYIALKYESWENLKNPKIDRSAVISVQLDDEETSIDATNNRVWERITTLDRLENTGKELGGICLARGDYDGVFIRGESAFWRLNDENKNALAVMEIDISYYTASEYTAIQFKKYKNHLAREYAKDAVILLREKQYSHDGSDDFESIGITYNEHIPDTSWRKGAKAKTFNEIKFYRTVKGIATSNDDKSPNWIVLKHNINTGRQGAPKYVYRLSESGFEAIKQIEANPAIAKRFWSWVDPDHNMGASYSGLVEATGNPLCSNLQPEGWFSSTDKKSWSEWTNGNIPNLPNSIIIKQRWVFDEQGCNWHYVDGTYQKRNYALQLAVFINDEPEISCLILFEKKHRFFEILTSDFKSPSALAALLSALWIEMDTTGAKNFLKKYIKQNSNISALVGLRTNVTPYYYSPHTIFKDQCNIVIPDDLDDDGECSQLYSVDADGNILWIADKYKGCLENPIIYQENAGIENAISYIQDYGLSVSDDNIWKNCLNKKGYLRLKDGGINPIVSPYLNELKTRIDGKTLKAVRDLHDDEFTWTISDEDDGDLWMLYPAQNPNYLRLEFCNQHEEISSGVKTLVHAILNGCGKTMSPAQLGLLNLMPLCNGGHKIADTESFPLSRKEIGIDENLSWVQESTDWHLMKNNELVCRFSYPRYEPAAAGTEYFSLPSIPITEDVTSAIIQFSKLLQQAAELPFIFKTDSEHDLSVKFPNIETN